MTTATRAVTGILLVCVLALSGCTSTEKKGSTPMKLSVSQVKVQIDALIRESVTALSPGASLGASLGDFTSVPCNDNNGSDLSGPVEVARSYFINGLEAANNDAYFDNFIQYWKGRGWHMHDDSRPRDPFLSMENNDGFGLALEATVDTGRISISGSSPCVKPDK